VSLSSEVMQMVKMVPRGFTATADAYLTPHIMRWACPAVFHALNIDPLKAIACEANVCPAPPAQVHTGIPVGLR
jgi:hypothetical protein